MGNSIDWQATAIQRLRDLEVNVFNPRRIVAPEQKLIADQINWELDSIAGCEFIFMHLAANTISPISLLELGLLLGGLRKHKTIIISCDPCYTRKDNVIVTLAHSVFGNPGNQDIHFTHSFEGGLIKLKEKIKIGVQNLNF